VTHRAIVQAWPVSTTETKPGRWAAQAGGLPGVFWYLWSGTLVNRLGSAVGPFLALYLTAERDFSTAQAGVVLTALGVGSAIAQPIGGVLADRLGRRATMLLGLVGAALTLLCVGAATTLPVLLVSVLVYGLFLDLVRPAVQAAVADVVPDRDRVRAYALNFWAINLGFAVAVPLGGFLAERGYWWLFALDAGTSLAFAVVVFLKVPESRPERRPDSDPGSLRDVLRDQLLLGLVTCVVLQAAVYMQAFITLPLVVAGDGLGAGGYGQVLGLNGVLIIVLQPLLLGVLARRHRGRMLLLAGVLQGVGIALHGFADTLLGHMAAVFVWTIGEVLQAGLLASVVAGLAPAHLRGRYMGIFGMAFGLAALVGPLLGTQILQHLGEAALWQFCAVAGSASGVGLLLVSGVAERRTHREESAATPSR
jgi:MFS family permease